MIRRIGQVLWTKAQAVQFVPMLGTQCRSAGDTDAGLRGRDLEAATRNRITDPGHCPQRFGAPAQQVKRTGTVMGSLRSLCVFTEPFRRTKIQRASDDALKMTSRNSISIGFDYFVGADREFVIDDRGSPGVVEVEIDLARQVEHRWGIGRRAIVETKFSLRTESVFDAAIECAGIALRSGRAAVR